MYFRLLLFLIVFIVPSCAKPQEVTIEEQMLMKSFAMHQAALVFDEFCNKSDPKNWYDFDKPESVNLIGNQQMIVAWVGGLQHIRFPDATVDELVQRLLKSSEIIKEKFQGVLKQKGCNSEEGNSAKSALKLYTKAHPAQVYSVISQQILKEGGTVTSSEEIENASKKMKVEK